MASSAEGTLRKADPNTIQDKFLVGYQGWFTCRGDGPPVHPGHHGWLHWFNRPIPEGGHPNMDLWPDVSAYSPSELFSAPGLSLPTGQPACLFSSRHPRTVRRHFHWMAEHGVDGCFLQRFVSQIEADGNTQSAKADLMRLRDEIGDRVREAAEQEGRVFAIMYDVSGVPANELQKVLEVDWNHLIRNRALLDSPNYLREQGKPVVAVWGVGFAKNQHDPTIITRIVRNMRDMTPGGAYVMAGTPTHWQTLGGDADPNPAFLDLYYNEFDAISPWTVGRYRDLDSADSFATHKIKGDMQAIEQNCNGRRIDYVPVVWPGGSEHNLSAKQHEPNFAPRDGGKFLWRQIFNAKHHGARILYGAMWDEYDEGTALMPAESYKQNLPRGGRFIALDVDGYDLPSDWYMRICGMAAEGLRGERRIFDTFPKKELDDYWSSRPKYDSPPAKASASGVGSGSGYQDWEKAEQEKEKEEIPPPPYTLESGEPSSMSPATPQPGSSGYSVQSAETSAPAVPLSARPGDSQQRPSAMATAVPAGQPAFVAQESAVAQGDFVGGFGQTQGLHPQSLRLLTEASSELVDELRRHTLADAKPHPNSTPQTSHSPPVPTHTRPTLQSYPSSISSTNSWSQAQFPPPEWNLPKPEDTQSHPSDLGYPAPHAHYSPLHADTPAPVPPRRQSDSSNQAPSPGWDPSSHLQKFEKTQSNNQAYPSTTDHGQLSQPYPFHPSSQQPQYLYAHTPHSSHSQLSPSTALQPHQHNSSPQLQFPSAPHSQSPQHNASQTYYYNPTPQPSQGPYPRPQYPPHSQSQSSNAQQPQNLSSHSGHAPYSQSPPPHGPPPTIPPRPVAGPSTSIPIPWGMVDKVAGKERRKKLEQGMDSVLQTGTKLLNKTPFNK